MNISTLYHLETDWVIVQNKTAVILGIISVFQPSLARACTTDRNYRFGKLVAYDVIREI
jgi:hypothetical protein